MPTQQNTFLAAPGTRRNRAIATVLALLVVLTVGALVQLAAQGDGGAAAPRPSGTSSAAPTPAAPVEDPDGVTATTGTDATAGPQLPTGHRVVDGVRVDYPHTVAGAVAAAVEYGTQVGSTLDLDRAAVVAAAVADDSFGDAGAHFVQGRVNDRAHLGLPSTGPVPAGASILLGPIAYQVRDVRPAHVTVLLLAYLTATSPARGIESFYAVFPYELAWFGGDWKASKQPAAAPDYSGLRRAPGTADATAAGWIDLTR